MIWSMRVDECWVVRVGLDTNCCRLMVLRISLYLLVAWTSGRWRSTFKSQVRSSVPSQGQYAGTSLAKTTMCWRQQYLLKMFLTLTHFTEWSAFFKFFSLIINHYDHQCSKEVNEGTSFFFLLPNKVYSQEMETRDMWKEVLRRFEKENSAINATDFYAGDRFALFIDLRKWDSQDRDAR